MKNLLIFICILSLLSLCACGKAQDNFQSPETAPAEDPVVSIPKGEENEAIDLEGLGKVEDTAENTDTEGPVEMTEEDIPLSADMIQTKYYTLTLPDSWAGKYACDIHERDNGSYSMSVHEKEAFLEFGGGTLFTIMMLPTSEDYSIFPSYDLLGALDTPDGTFNLIALFPTDVQFTEDTAQTYNAMYDAVQDVLYTITPTDGIEMAMP